MPPSLSELKVTPSFCFPFKIPDDPTASIKYINPTTTEKREKICYHCHLKEIKVHEQYLVHRTF